MAWEGAGMTAPINQEGNMTMEDPAFAGMTWVGAGYGVGGSGMTESPTCCGPGAINAAKVNETRRT